MSAERISFWPIHVADVGTAAMVSATTLSAMAAGGGAGAGAEAATITPARPSEWLRNAAAVVGDPTPRCRIVVSPTAPTKMTTNTPTGTAIALRTARRSD